MPSTVWNKYKKLNQIYENSNIKPICQELSLILKKLFLKI